MIQFVVSIYDQAAGTYSRPVFTPTLAVAVRSFSDEINDVNSQIHKHYKDYDLYHLASFDDESGSFDPAGAKPVLVMRGVNARMPLDQPST